MTYECPEIMEIGPAEALTLGCCENHVPDGCDCLKGSPVIVDQG